MTHIDITNVQVLLLTAPGGGLLLYLLMKAIKKTGRLTISGAIHTLTMILSGVIAVCTYIAQYHNLPIEVLAVTGPGVYGFSQAVYQSAIYLQKALPSISAFLTNLGNRKSAPAATDTIQSELAALQPAADIAPSTSQLANTTEQPVTENEFNL